MIALGEIAFLDDSNLAEDTIVNTSDQGFFLGEHGWFDKRFIYESRFRCPFINLTTNPGIKAAAWFEDDICTTSRLGAHFS